MNATAISGYRLKLNNWESPTASARKAPNAYDPDRVILVMPDMTINDSPYVVSAEMTLYSARETVKALNRAIKLLDPPKPRKKRG
jgi:hypothetical protein